MIKSAFPGGNQNFIYIFKFILLSILTVTCLTACGGGSSSTMGQEDLKVMISGVLTDASGLPIDGARVGLDNGPFEAISASDGSFSFEANSTHSDGQDLNLLIQGPNFTNLLRIPRVPSAAKALALKATINRESADAKLDSLDIEASKPVGAPHNTPGPLPPTQTTPSQNEATPKATATIKPTPSSASDTPAPILTEIPTPLPTSTPIPDPSSPRNVQAQIANSNSALSWQNTEPAATSFVIYRARAAAGPFDAISEVSASSTQFTDTYATDRIESLYYRVSAKVGAFESVASQAVLASPLSDLNQDGCVDSSDQSILGSLLNNPGAYNAAADLNSDSSITLSDAVIFSSWVGWCRQ